MWIAGADPGAVNGPPWLGLVAGGVFTVAGVTVATQETPIAAWTGPVGAGLIVAGFAAIASWIAFGAGPRRCTGGISFLFFSVGGRTGEIECRIAFGLGALLVDALLVAMLAGGLVRLLPDRAWAQKLKKGSEWLIWIALAPVLIPLVLWAAGASVWRTLRERGSS